MPYFHCYQCNTQTEREKSGQGICAICAKANKDYLEEIERQKKEGTYKSKVKRGSGYAGYNRALDTYVRSESHYKELVKEQGLTEVG